MVMRSGSVAWESYSNDPTSDLMVVISCCCLSRGDDKDVIESTLRTNLQGGVNIDESIKPAVCTR